MSWTTARLAEFNAMRAVGMWRATISYKGTEYVGIRVPVITQNQMGPNNYMEVRPDEFTMLKSEFESSGIAIKDRYTADSAQFEIFSIQTDEAEPTVVLRANRKQ